MSSLIVDNWYVIAAIISGAVYLALRKWRGLAIILLLFAHLLCAAAGAMAFLDFESMPGSSDEWTGLGYYAITTVLGFPWSIAPWAFDWIDRAPWTLWLGFFVNYMILWRLTFASLGWAFPKEATDGTPERAELSTATKLWAGVLLPLVPFVVYQLLLFRSLPAARWEREALLLATVAIVPALAVANWWVLRIQLRTRKLAFLVGLALPSCVALVEFLWSVNSHVFASMPHEFRPLVVFAFFLPLLISLIYRSRPSSAPPSVSSKGTSP